MFHLWGSQSWLQPPFRRLFARSSSTASDEIIVFRALDIDNLSKITRKLLNDLTERILEQNILLEFDDAAVRLVCEMGYDALHGARPLARAVERLVSRPLSEKLLGGEIQPGDKYRVAAEAGRIQFRKVEEEE